MDRKIYRYDLVGYDAYFDTAFPEIEAALKDVLGDEEGHFLIAINEAVCNAAKYALDGDDKAAIKLELAITEDDVTASIACPTKHFDADRYRQDLQSLAANKQYRLLPWSDYTGVSARSRGFWLMLMAVDYLYIRHDGNSISLNVSRPWRQDVVTKTIGELVPRFLVEKNGVIY